MKIQLTNVSEFQLSDPIFYKQSEMWPCDPRILLFPTKQKTQILFIVFSICRLHRNSRPKDMQIVNRNHKPKDSHSNE